VADAEFPLARHPGVKLKISEGLMMRCWIAGAFILLLNLPAGAEECTASVYWVGEPTQPGTETASGVPLDNGALTAAHKSLPLNSKVKVTNKQNGKTVTLTITDRGPYVSGRCIDVTKAGAEALGIAGLAPVNVAPSAED
jgi:rare lipoprotein A (peptidoglycan hydrolase)